MKPYPQSVAITMCLGVGLILRDLDFAQFQADDADQDDGNLDLSNRHVAKSVLDWGHCQALLLACRDVSEDMGICFDAGQEDSFPVIPSVRHHGLIDSCTPEKKINPSQVIPVPHPIDSPPAERERRPLTVIAPLPVVGDNGVEMCLPEPGEVFLGFACEMDSNKLR
jgi:hypothetical protein